MGAKPGGPGFRSELRYAPSGGTRTARRATFRGVVLILLMAAFVPETHAARERFLTNLGLLEQLTREAVSSLLDSLDVSPGDSITLLSATGHEGSDFVGDALARDLSMRGLQVRIARESVPTLESPSEDEENDSGGENQANQNRSSGDQGRQFTEGFPAGLAGGGGADTSAAGADSSFFGSGADSTRAHAGGGSTGGSVGGSVGSSGRQPGEAPADTASKAPGGEPETAPASSPPPLTFQTKTYPEGPVLEYRILEFGVTYPSLKRRYLLFGGASVHRLGGVYLQASKIMGPRGMVMDVGSGQSHWEDRLSAHSRALAEGSSYPFLKPAVPPANIGKYIEPMAVLGIVTSLVYLFYQNQH